jgi:hypothetical protein
LRRNWHIKHIIEGNKEGRMEGEDEEEEDLSSYGIASRKEKTLESVGGNTRSHSVENSVWRSLWTCRKTDCVMGELKNNYQENKPLPRKQTITKKTNHYQENKPLPRKQTITNYQENKPLPITKKTNP